MSGPVGPHQSLVSSGSNARAPGVLFKYNPARWRHPGAGAQHRTPSPLDRSSNPLLRKQLRSRDRYRQRFRSGVPVDGCRSLSGHGNARGRQMLRIMQRLLGLAKPQPASTRTAETAVLLVRVPPQPAPAPPPSPQPAQLASLAQVTLPVGSAPPAAYSPPPTAAQPGARAAPTAAAASHKPSDAAVDSTPASAAIATPPPDAERAALPLAALGAISDRLLRKLRRAGLRSCDDLLAADPAALAQRIGAPHHYAARLRRYQRAIRYSRRFSAMTPHEALLLLAAHRCSPAGLGAENAGMLQRDLERLLLSSHGQRLAPGGTAPELQRVRQWIVEAKAIQERKKRALLAAQPDSQLPRIAPARK